MAFKGETIFTFEQVEQAYRLLKREIYAQKQNLFLRHRLAEFEMSRHFERQLRMVLGVANADDPLASNPLHDWLNLISYVLLPKSLMTNEPPPDSKKPRYFSNKTTFEYYGVDKVNYFFDGPIELHILSALWLLTDGRILDQSLSESCMGNRLHDSVINQKSTATRLFRGYAPQYGKWRDSAIRVAERMLREDHRDVCVLSLDFEAFYYRLRPDFGAMEHCIIEGREASKTSLRQNNLSLLRVVEATCLRYQEVIWPSYSLTHGGDDIPSGVPLDLFCAPVIANWSLRDFDRLVEERVSPFYYGRYVDDVLLVVSAHGVEESETPVEDMIRRQFVERGILLEKGNAYYFREMTGARLQSTKCVLHYFDADDTHAALENFAERIRQQSSEFRELPDLDFEQPFREIAWELLYDGPEARWRSVTGISEDKNELARYLHKWCVVALYAKTGPEYDSVRDIERFFRGRNVLRYFDQWERLLTLLCLLDAAEALQRVLGNIANAIDVTFFRKEGTNGAEIEVEDRLRSTLKRHLTLSFGMALAVAAEETDSDLQVSDSGTIAKQFLQTQMERHYFKRIPYKHQIDGTVSIKHAPRFVPFEDCLLSRLLPLGEGPVSIKAVHEAMELFASLNGVDLKDVKVSSIELGESANVS